MIINNKLKKVFFVIKTYYLMNSICKYCKYFLIIV